MELPFPDYDDNGVKYSFRLETLDESYQRLSCLSTKGSSVKRYEVEGDLSKYLLDMLSNCLKQKKNLSLKIIPSEGELRAIMTFTRDFEEPLIKELVMKGKKLSPEDVLHLALGSNQESVGSEEVTLLKKQLETLEKKLEHLAETLLKGESKPDSRLHELEGTAKYIGKALQRVSGIEKKSLDLEKLSSGHEKKTLELEKKAALLEKKISELEQKLSAMPRCDHRLPTIILGNATCRGSGYFWEWATVDYCDTDCFTRLTKTYTNDSVVVSKKGLYLVNARTTTVAYGSHYYMSLYKNGSAHTYSYHAASAAYYDTCVISIVLLLNAGDFLQIYETYNSSPLNASNYLYNSFCVTFMGEAK